MTFFSSHKFKFSAACLSIMLLSACSQDETSAVSNIDAPLKPVRTMVITEGSKTVKSFTGVVGANKTAQLGFRVNGELNNVNIKEGDEVKRGQVLAVLDQTDFKISLQSSQAEYDRSNSEFNRAKKLIKQGAISTADYEKLKAKQANASAQLSSAKQNLKYTTLSAPFAGVIAKIFFENFEKISSSNSFVTIQDLSSLEVQVNIPESVMIKVKQEDSTRSVYAVFDGDETHRYPLQFKEVSTRADEKKQTYAVKFVMEYPDGINLLPGMSARVYAVHSSISNNEYDIYIPAHAVLEDGQGRFVYVAIPGKNDQAIINRRAVVVGKLNENGIEIIHGLSVGDSVVTAGMSKMSQDLVVRMISED